jgi:hypothetical protein
MSFDPAAMGTILDMLTNIYSNPDHAVVQEYSSNAIDSHIEAGNTGPILITSPTQFSPIFTVQDFGVGLSEEEVLNVYARYGASTKRETDEQIGAFGIGAKSAFAVGPQFVVTAVKDGWQTIALFALNEDGAPTVNIMSSTQTDEPNGVKVEIGVRDVQAVSHAIASQFPTWKPGSVLVDGVEPAFVWNELDELTPSVHFGWREDHINTRHEAWTVVMGGISYPLPDAVINSLPNRQLNVVRTVQQSRARVYLTVPIGAVDITPSREALRVTDKTTTTIRDLVEEFSAHIGAWISSQIEDATSLIEALIKYRNLRNQLGSIDRHTLTSVTWQGQPLPVIKIEFPDVTWIHLRNKRGYYGEKVASREKKLSLHPAEVFEKYLFVTDVPARKTRTVQLSAKPYLTDEATRNGVARVVALTEPVDSYKTDWFDLSDPALQLIDYDTFVKAWKPASTPAQRGEVQYHLHDDSDTVTAAELNQEPDVFYLNHAESQRISKRSSLFLKVAGTTPVVLLTHQQKQEALVRRVPHAKSLAVAMAEAARKLVENPNVADKALILANLYVRSSNSTNLRWLAERKNKITNKVVLDVIETYQASVALQEVNPSRMGLLRSAAEFLHTSLENPPDGEYFEGLRAISDDLPLLDSYLYRGRFSTTPVGDEHAIRYINSIKL